MAASDEIILCSLLYHHQEISGMCVNNTQQERHLLIKNNTIYVDSVYNCNPKTRNVILHIDFEIDKDYIENLKTLLFGVLRRNEANKHVYRSYRPVPQYPIIWMKENIVDFITPIKLYNELYLLQKNMQQQIIKKDAEISALKQLLEEKDNTIKQTNSTFSLDKLVACPADDDDFIEATWP
jgi:uncharacterized protein with FMN-binding domain